MEKKSLFNTVQGAALCFVKVQKQYNLDKFVMNVKFF